MKEANICNLWRRMCVPGHPLATEAGKCRRMDSEWGTTNIYKACDSSTLGDTDTHLIRFIEFTSNTQFSAII